MSARYKIQQFLDEHQKEQSLRKIFHTTSMN